MSEDHPLIRPGLFSHGRITEMDEASENKVRAHMRQAINTKGLGIIGAQTVPISELNITVGLCHTIGRCIKDEPEFLMFGSDDVDWLQAVHERYQALHMGGVESRQTFGRGQKVWVRPINNQSLARRVLWRVPEVTGVKDFSVWQVVLADPLGYFPPQADFPFNLAPLI